MDSSISVGSSHNLLMTHSPQTTLEAEKTVSNTVTLTSTVYPSLRQLCSFQTYSYIHVRLKIVGNITVKRGALHNSA